MAINRFLLASRDAALLQVWSIAFESQQLPLLTTPELDSLEREIVAGLGDAKEVAVLIDLAYLGSRGIMLHDWVASMRKLYRDCDVIAIAAHGAHVTQGQIQWAQKCGATVLFPRAHVVEMPGVMQQLCEVFDKPFPAAGAASGATLLGKTGFSTEEAQRELEFNRLVDNVLAQNSTNLQKLVQELDGSDGLTHSDRRYRLKNYHSCLVASDMVAWLAKRLSIARPDAVKVGLVMQRQGLIYHVVYKQDFADQKLYFRLAHNTPKIDAIFIQVVLQKLLQNKHGLVTNRTYNGKTYQHCFIGEEFTHWLVKQHRFSVENAIDIGRQLFELGAFHHVLNEHPFIDGYYYYALTGNPLPH
jgi:Domain found in Dishevelled, Egl-10, and Pleckstrin (DEP)